MGRTGEDQEGGVVVHGVDNWYNDGKSLYVICLCGAHWSHDAKVKIEEVEEIMKAHVKYFNNKTLVL